MSCPSWQGHRTVVVIKLWRTSAFRTGYRWSPVRTRPVAPLWCDLGCCSRTVVVIKLQRTFAFKLEATPDPSYASLNLALLGHAPSKGDLHSHRTFCEVCFSKLFRGRRRRSCAPGTIYIVCSCAEQDKNRFFCPVPRRAPKVIIRQRSNAKSQEIVPM